MREIIIARYCDLHYHWEDRTLVDAEVEYRAQIDGQIRVLELCVPCSKVRLPLAELMQLFADLGTPDIAPGGKPSMKGNRSYPCRYPGCAKPGPYTKQGRSNHESRRHGGIYSPE